MAMALGAALGAEVAVDRGIRGLPNKLGCKRAVRIAQTEPLSAPRHTVRIDCIGRLARKGRLRRRHLVAFGDACRSAGGLLRKPLS